MVGHVHPPIEMWSQMAVCTRCGAIGVPHTLYVSINGVVMPLRHTWAWPEDYRLTSYHHLD